MAECYKNQSDKKCAFAKLLQFLESDAGKKNCFQFIEAREDGERKELRGRVNQFDVIIHNGKKINFPAVFSKKTEVGLGADNFSFDVAKQRLAEAIFKMYGLEESASDALCQELQCWPAISMLETFLPKASLEALDSTTVAVMLGKRQIAKASASSIHVAKHQAAVKVFQDNQYKAAFCLSGDKKSCGFARADLACPVSASHENMTQLLKKNLLPHAGSNVYDFDESSGQVYAQFAVEKSANTNEIAAKRVYEVLENLRIDGMTKKQRAAQRREELQQHIKSKKAKILDANAVSAMVCVTSKLNLEAAYEYNDDKQHDELFKCKVTVDGIECIGKDTSKKQAKVAAARAMVHKLTKKHPDWYAGNQSEAVAE